MCDTSHAQSICKSQSKRETVSPTPTQTCNTFWKSGSKATRVTRKWTAANFRNECSVFTDCFTLYVDIYLNQALHSAVDIVSHNVVSWLLSKIRIILLLVLSCSRLVWSVTTSPNLFQTRRYAHCFFFLSSYRNIKEVKTRVGCESSPPDGLMKVLSGGSAVRNLMTHGFSLFFSFTFYV